MLKKLRREIVLLVIGLYLVLSWGFMLVRVPLGGSFGLPTAELLLVIFALTFVFDLSNIRAFSRSVILLPFLVWWGCGFTHLLLSIDTYGVWALRDSTHVVESLFVWIGFVVAYKPKDLDRVFSWFGRVLIVVCIYGLGYPFQAELRALSPTIVALAGYTATVFFWYMNTGLLMLLAAAGVLVYWRHMRPIWSEAVFILIVVYVIVVFQTRTIYLQALALMFILVWYRRASLSTIGRAGAVAAGFLLVVAALGALVPGRLGGVFSLELLYDHFMSSFGVSAPHVDKAADGFFLRVEWWSTLANRLTANSGATLFGLGYGFPLVDFKTPGLVAVREPHNSFVSIIGRLGLIGILSFIWMHFLLFRTLLRSIILCRKQGNKRDYNRLIIFGLYFIFILILCIGEDALEKPYNAVPYYFLWGIILRLSLQLKEQSRRQSSVATMWTRAPQAQVASS